MGAGTAACYRGDVLYSDDEGQSIVKKWTDFYKAHRGTLIQPVVHLRRPNIQSWDGWMHVNPLTVRIGEKENENVDVAVAMIFNPTPNDMTSNIFFPMYYTGIMSDGITHDHILVSVNEGDFVKVPLKYGGLRGGGVTVEMKLPETSIHSVVFRLDGGVQKKGLRSKN